MSRTEYRLGYQIGTPDDRRGRVWWRICHTKRQTLDFYSYLVTEARKKNRGVVVVGVQSRPVGHWAPVEGGLQALMDVRAEAVTQ